MSTEIKFTPITYDQFLAGVEDLAVQIESGDWKPDFIVGIGRGGLAPGCFLSHRTGIPLLSIDHSSKVFHFAESLLVHLAVCTRAGERYLFVDDINDSGGTITHVKAALAEAGGSPDNVRFATLIDNIVSAERVDYRFRTIDRGTNKDWFVFPWEQVSPIDKLIEDSGVVPARIA